MDRLRILRLTLSDDVVPLPAGAQRSWQIAERMLAEKTGLPVETTLRIIWPEPELPRLLAGWLDRYQPEIVTLKVSPYWFTYESVPLRLRRLPLLGRWLAKAGLHAAEADWLAQNALFRTGRRALRRVIGGDTYFTPDEVVRVMDECIRVVLRREGVVLAVRGPLEADDDRNAGARVRGEQRRRLVHQRLRRLCAELYVHYSGADEVEPVPKGADQLHLSASGHEEKGREEGEALIDAWRHAQREPAVSLYLNLNATRRRTPILVR